MTNYYLYLVYCQKCVRVVISVWGWRPRNPFNSTSHCCIGHCFRENRSDQTLFFPNRKITGASRCWCYSKNKKEEENLIFFKNKNEINSLLEGWFIVVGNTATARCYEERTRVSVTMETAPVSMMHTCASIPFFLSLSYPIPFIYILENRFNLVFFSWVGRRGNRRQDLVQQ